MLSKWSINQDRKPGTGTVEANGFDGLIDSRQVAPVIAVGYSSVKHEWRSRGFRGFLLISAFSPGKSQVTWDSRAPVVW
jgi:hypothetical protein